ncbi:D-alanyl-D-alanine carboxypeptidase family protein [Streptomyces sp. NPDC058001]|uniref:D-alanyl-D-alanine carboxypeptidase family protein n=1 Tax=Streptomyces sp. NPDC058001 TaxID=3346300 RepID=UPI0036E4DF5C
MAIRYVSRPGSARNVALAIGALMLVSGPVAVARPTEPEPPRPRPAPAGTALEEPGVRSNPGSPGTPAPPSDVSALSWVVADAGSGEVLAARDAHRKLPPASTLKTLFAVTTLPHLRATSRHTVSEDELSGVGDGSSMVGVSAGHTYRVADLWRGVFLSSGNDAVRVLAAMNGGVEDTVRQMQAKAVSLGARDTHVVSPDGYDADEQVSSAYDLAVFGRAGLTDPEFARYCATELADFPGDGYTYPIQNTNRLLTGEDGVVPYRGLIGVKNGYTTNAGNTLIAAAERDGRTILVSVMNPQDGDGHAVYEEARSLLNWGFAAVGHVRPIGSLVPPPAEPRPAAPPEPMAVAVGQSDEDSVLSASPVALAGAAGSAFVLTGLLVLRARRRRRQAGREE